MSYYCDCCNYLAENSSNFSNHKKTKKHLLLFSKSTSDNEKNHGEINEGSIGDHQGSFNDPKCTAENLGLNCEFCGKNYL